MSARRIGVGVLLGVLAVAAAVVVGAALAWLLGVLGLTETPVRVLGPWLAGLGLLGGWQQEVTSDVAGGIGWSTWAAGAPLLVTAAAVAVVGAAARRGTLDGAAGPAAVLGAASASAVLVATSVASTTTTNDVGSVTRTEGLTLWWTGGTRPGTVTGCMLLVAAAVLVGTRGRRWWAAGRAVALGLLVWPGLALSLALCGAAAWLTSTTSVGIALLALYPLVGTTALLAVGGAPAQVGLTRISPQPYDLSTWAAGPLVVAGGLLGALAIGVLVGLVLRWRRHRGPVAAGISVPAALALVITWAMATTVDVPDPLGGITRVATNPVAAAAVASAMAVVALLVRGRRPVPVAPSTDEVGTGGGPPEP